MGQLWATPRPKRLLVGDEAIPYDEGEISEYEEDCPDCLATEYHHEFDGEEVWDSGELEDIQWEEPQYDQWFEDIEDGSDTHDGIRTPSMSSSEIEERLFLIEVGEMTPQQWFDRSHLYALMQQPGADIDVVLTEYLDLGYSMKDYVGPLSWQDVAMESKEVPEECRIDGHCKLSDLKQMGDVGTTIQCVMVAMLSWRFTGQYRDAGSYRRADWENDTGQRVSIVVVGTTVRYKIWGDPARLRKRVRLRSRKKGAEWRCPDPGGSREGHVGLLSWTDNSQLLIMDDCD